MIDFARKQTSFGAAVAWRVGVTLVSLVGAFALHPPAAAAQQFLVERELVIDAEAADLSSIGFVEAFPDGGIVIAQPQDHRLLLFDPNGRLRKTVGREGAGPGEFSLLAWSHGFVGDSLWTWDASLRRYSLIAPTGKFVGGVTARSGLTLASGARLPGSMAWVPFGVAPGRSMLVGVNLAPRLRLPVGWSERLAGDRFAILRADRGGARARLIAGAPEDVQVCGREPQLREECPRPMITAGPDGTPFVVVTVALNDHATSIHVQGYDAQGGRLFDRTIPFHALQLSNAARDSIRSVWVGSARNGEAREKWRQAEYPKFYKPVQHLLVAHDRSLWIALRQKHQVLDWLILNPDGSTRGWLELPLTTNVEAARWPLAWGTEESESGLENVVRYRLIQPR